MNMTTVPSNQLKAMQQEIESLKEQVALLSHKVTKAMQVENIKLREKSMQFAIDLETDRNRVITLKEQVAQWETEYNGCSTVLNNAERTIETLEETIAQQAEAIRVAAEQIRRCDYTPARSTLLNASSPEILQARDKRVAEAVTKYLRAVGVLSYEGTALQGITSGEWRKYL